MAFVDLCGVFYPAVSLNRNVQVTLHSALDPPPASASFPDSGEESDEGQNVVDVSERSATTTTGQPENINSLSCAAVPAL